MDKIEIVALIRAVEDELEIPRDYLTRLAIGHTGIDEGFQRDGRHGVMFLTEGDLKRYNKINAQQYVRQDLYRAQANIEVFKVVMKDKLDAVRSWWDWVSTGYTSWVQYNIDSMSKDEYYDINKSFDNLYYLMLVSPANYIFYMHYITNVKVMSQDWNQTCSGRMFVMQFNTLEHYTRGMALNKYEHCYRFHPDAKKYILAAETPKAMYCKEGKTRYGEASQNGALKGKKLTSKPDGSLPLFGFEYIVGYQEWVMTKLSDSEMENAKIVLERILQEPVDQTNINTMTITGQIKKEKTKRSMKKFLFIASSIGGAFLFLNRKNLKNWRLTKWLF